MYKNKKGTTSVQSNVKKHVLTESLILLEFRSYETLEAIEGIAIRMYGEYRSVLSTDAQISKIVYA